MTTRLAITMAVLLAAASIEAAEHPKEHPTGASGQQEHPAQTPSAPPQAQPAQSPMGVRSLVKPNILKTYETVVREYAKAESDEPFVVHDDKLNKDWKLKLVRVHKDRIVSLGKNRFFACSDFKSVKKGERGKLDLDFIASKNPDGTWNMEKVLIHKVNGKPRYTWNKKNEMVPATD